MVCCDAHGSSPEPGTVVVKDGPAERRRVKVPRSGRFSTSLPPGRYHVIGGIPSLGWTMGRCVVDRSARTWVRIRRTRTTDVKVVCQGQ